MIKAVRSNLVEVQHELSTFALKIGHKLSAGINKICILWKAFLNKTAELYKNAFQIIPCTLRRITTGLKYVADFPMPHLEQQKVRVLMEKFIGFSLTSQIYYGPKPVINEQIEKLKEMIARGDPEAKHMKTLLKRCEDPKFHRGKFDGHDTICLEKANFELAKEYLVDLAEFYNTKHFDRVNKSIMDYCGLNFYEAVIAEVLARTIAYNTHLDGQTLPLPVLRDDGTYGIAKFKIKLYCLGDELPAYILECEEKDEHGKDKYNPWFVVRGTETSSVKTKDGKKIKMGGWESFLADTIPPDGVGDGVVDKCLRHHKTFTLNGKKIVQPSLSKVFANRKFKLAGHSLGGNLVNQIGAHLYDNVEKVYGFCGPGVTKRIYEIWESKSKPGDDKLFNIAPKGDLVPAAGEKLIGKHLALKHLTKPKEADFVHVHVLMCLTQPFTLQLVDNRLEEKQIGRVAMETVRRSIGYVVRKTMEKVLRWEFPDWYTNRDIFMINPLDLYAK